LDIAAEELDVSYGGKHLLVRFNSFAGDPQLVVLSKNGDASPRSYAWVKTNVRRKRQAPKKERGNG
jgi:hypothetical protein